MRLLPLMIVSLLLSTIQPARHGEDALSRRSIFQIADIAVIGRCVADRALIKMCTSAGRVAWPSDGNNVASPSPFRMSL